jgi:hypothetical protein
VEKILSMHKQNDMQITTTILYVQLKWKQSELSLQRYYRINVVPIFLFIGSTHFSAFFPTCKFLFILTWLGLLTLIRITSKRTGIRKPLCKFKMSCTCLCKAVEINCEIQIIKDHNLLSHGFVSQCTMHSFLWPCCTKHKWISEYVWCL